MQRCAGALRYLTCRTQRGRTKLIETWQSGIDDKWGVSPVWRAPALVPTETGDATARRGQLTFMRECETFRVFGWPIRLRQTWYVARGGGAKRLNL